MYMAAGSLYKSTDGGFTWTKMLQGAVTLVDIEPGNPSTIYAGFYGGLLKSTDGGHTWTRKDTGLPADASMSALVIDPLSPSTLYVGLRDGTPVPGNTSVYAGVYKTSDGGTSWAPMLNGFPQSSSPRLINGQLSTIVSAPVYDLAINPVTPAQLYAYTPTGVVKSSNGGNSWSLLALSPPLPPSSGLEPIGGVLAIDPLHPSTIALGTHDPGGIYVSHDGGFSWSFGYIETTNVLSTSAIVPDPVMPGAAYAIGTVGTDEVLFHIDMAGSHSTPTYLGSGVSPGLAMSAGATYYGVENGVVAQGTYVSLGADVAALAIDPLHPAIVYAGTLGQGIFKSTDSGKQWSPINVGLTNFQVGRITIERSNPSHMFIGTLGGVFQSMNGGDTWSPVNLPGLSGQSDVPATVVIDPALPSVLYALTSGHGIFISDDSGQSWRPSNSGLTDLHITDLQFEPTNPKHIFIGTFGGGVFHSIDGGNAWTRLGTGLDDAFVTILYISDTSGSFPRILVGTADRGLFQTQAPVSAPTLPSLDGSLLATLTLLRSSVADVISVTYPPVSLAGSVTVLLLDADQEALLPPPGYTISDPSLAYEIESTADAYGQPVKLCFSLASVTDETLFNGLTILHYVNGQPVVEPTTRNFVDRTLCTQVTSFSPFVIASDIQEPVIVAPLTGPTSPVRVGAFVTLLSTLSDPDRVMSTAMWDWGDGTSSTFTPVSGAVSGNHAYSATGIYTIKLKVTDTHGNTVETAFQYVVVYDPNGGVVTGGGWIDGPARAYVAAPTLAGRANFGFNAKYQKGSAVPTGQTQFSLPDARLHFHSTSYAWLVISGATAEYQGEGTVNGTGRYGFLLTVIDGQAGGGGGTDKFRLKIWDEDNNDTVIYDNEIGATDGAAPTTIIGGGDLVIHK
jgi:photosystem II stability/assembly factor-like uncharacterized protein